MATAITLILPNQLFDIPADNICLYEHPLYFTAFLYHKYKLILHRSSMRHYFDTHLARTKKYINYNEDLDTYLSTFSEITLYDPVDHGIVSQFTRFARRHGLKLHLLRSPMFICPPDEPFTYHKQFYVAQCKKYKIHPDIDGTSYDQSNREPFPADVKDPVMPIIDDDYTAEASAYVAERFAKNPGSVINVYLPYTPALAETHFDRFVRERLAKFGPYEDAMSKNVVFGYHSCVSALLNIGILLPMNVVKRVAKAKVPIESKEGFIRQIFWREYIRLCYMKYYKQLQTSNLLQHTNKLPFWLEETSIEPINYAIRKFNRYGWLHHIERLMLVGSFALIHQTNPTYVNDWFMMFVDAYPWVMLPNVYGMSQYSAGNLIMKRPYFCSSNYIVKMSDFRGNWTDIWDTLYYYFIYTHRKLLQKTYAYASAVSRWNKKPVSERRRIIVAAQAWLYQYQ